ncbi:MAG: guanylate kinase [Gammaproteobacteria bacterium]|nr:guanylate kinase [Gammaproteobacteria bacterium]
MTTGTLFIVSAPSGAGKTSLLRRLLENDPDLQASVSHTTRPMRPGEIDGVDYWFVSKEAFRHLVEAELFLEHAQVFENDYGTSESEVKRVLDSGRDVVLEIDWQGARQVRQRFPQAVSVFILPPGLEVLRSRLVHRGQDTDDVIDLRMAKARNEMKHYVEYDYLVFNDDFELALNELRAVIQSQRLRQPVQSERYKARIRSLLAP